MAIAVFLMVVACTLIPLGDTAGKLMMQGHGYDPLFIAWARMVVGAASMIAIVAVLRPPLSGLGDWRSYLRGAFLVATIACIVTGLQSTDIGTAFGAFFLGPPLSFVLSMVLLGERASPAQGLLLALGFLGVLLVAKPGFGMTAGVGFAVMAGVFYGLFLVSSRWIAGQIPATVLVLIPLLLGSVVLAPLGLGALPAGPWPWGLLLVSGGASFLGNLALIAAYTRAEATRLAPFVYLMLVAATGFGLVVFGTLPDALALLGLGLLLISGFATLGLKPPPIPRATRPRSG